MADDISNRTPPVDAPTAPVSIANMPASASPVAASALEAARERTIRLLTDRFADDSLDLEQFEAHLDRMYKATTVAELDGLLRDVEARTARRAAVAPAYGEPAYGELPAPRRVLSIMSNTERTGRWAMPRQLEVRALMSSIVLDLRETSIPAGVCEIDLLAIMANVEILVAPGVVVEDLALGVMANVENRALDERIVPADAPRIRITGTAVMANVEVRMGPTGMPFRAAWREARKAWRRRRRGEW
jgi:hypothetical protein